MWRSDRCIQLRRGGTDCPRVVQVKTRPPCLPPTLQRATMVSVKRPTISSAKSEIRTPICGRNDRLENSTFPPVTCRRSILTRVFFSASTGTGADGVGAGGCAVGATTLPICARLTVPSCAMISLPRGWSSSRSTSSRSTSSTSVPCAQHRCRLCPAPRSPAATRCQFSEARFFWRVHRF